MACCVDINKPGAIKVPVIITIWFWIIKVLCTTVGESVADWLNENIGLGLGLTTVVMALLFGVTLIAQFTVSKYVPVLYWLNVMLVSVVGTLVTDLLVDEVGVELWVCVIIFRVLMLATFGIWFYLEKTLCIHSINTMKREKRGSLQACYPLHLRIGHGYGRWNCRGPGFGILASTTCVCWCGCIGAHSIQSALLGRRSGVLACIHPHSAAGRVTRILAFTRYRNWRAWVGPRRDVCYLFGSHRSCCWLPLIFQIGCAFGGR